MINKIKLFLNKYIKSSIFILGIFSSFGFAPLHIFPITILSYLAVIFIFKNKNINNTKVFIYSFIYGLGNHIGLLYWISISFETAQAGGYIAGVLAVFILCSFLSIFIAIPFYLLFTFKIKKESIIFGLLFIFIFTLFDWLKGNILWGFPWIPISGIWGFSRNTLYPFSVFGVWGYSVITFSLIISFYYSFSDLKKFFLFSAPFLFMVLILPNIYKYKEESYETLNIRLVQPNIKQEDKWDSSKFIVNNNKVTSLLTKKNYEDKDLIILPETTINFNIKKLNISPHAENFQLNNLSNLLIGAVRVEKVENNIEVFNSMYMKKKNYSDYLYYDKIKLVPFGEFIPFRHLLRLNKLTSGSLDFTAGEEIKIFTISKKLKILPLICYEVIFPDLISNLDDDFNIIVNITNDAWYRKSSGPYQHFSLARIRAVMEGVTLIRVANTGISGIIESNGTISSSLNLGSEGIIDKKLNIKRVYTLYSLYRESIFHFIMLTLLFLICISFFYNIRKKKLN